MFFDRIVLDQSWALDAIYAAFDRKRVYQVLRDDGGRFSRAKLGLLVWQEHSDAEQKLLLSMMVSCGICFLHRRFGGADDDNAEYIAPDLLPERKAIAERLMARWAEDRPGEAATFHYALLHGGLIRSIMAEIGQMAGVDALYWRGGFCVFDTDTRSRLLIQEEMTGDWQGVLRVRTQDGQAALMLQKAVKVIERVQTRLSMRPVDVERSSPAIELPASSAISPGPEKPKMPEWYVSYAWGDDRTPEGRARKEIVDQLCDVAEAEGHHILRDQDVLSLGDSISAFMRQIGGGDRIFVILSDKYLRSPFCMFELSEVWRTSKQQGKAFLDRVRIYALSDANVSKPVDWANWAVHWKQEHDELDAIARQHGAALLGEHGHRRLMQMQTFYTQVADILGTLADIVQPRTFEELKRYGFEDLPHRP
jgi:internalin A